LRHPEPAYRKDERVKDTSWLTPRRALAAYAVLFSLFIVWASLGAVLGQDAHHGIGVRWLGIVEIGGALFFVARQTRAVGLVALLIVFAIATAIELQIGLWPVRFLFYAGSALFVQYLSAALPAD
jgi:hypothetical protein